MTTQPGDRSWRGRDYLLPATSVAFGLIYLVAGIIGDNIGFGLFGLALMTVVGVALLAVRRRSETVDALMTRRDERINSYDLQATALSGMAVIVAVIAGFVVEIARGNDPAPYSWLGAIAGVTYLIALIALRIRG
jgi:hypothetical protein